MNNSQIEKLDSMLSAISSRNLSFQLQTETGKNLAEINYRAINCGSGIKLMDTNTNRYYDCKGRDTIDFPVTISIGVAYRIVIDALKAMALPVTENSIVSVETTEIPATIVQPVIVESVQPVEMPNLKKSGKKSSRKIQLNP